MYPGEGPTVFVKHFLYYMHVFLRVCQLQEVVKGYTLGTYINVFHKFNTVLPLLLYRHLYIMMLIVLTVISLAPSILIMLTSFTRIVIVLHFTRAAIGTQTVPPNQVIIGLSLFLTVFVMTPTFTEVYNNAVVPLSNNEMTVQEAFDEGIKPLRTFMLKQTSTKDLDTFLKIAGYEEGSVTSEDDISMTVLVPSFIISELRIAFIIGFLIYIPFIIIDMVVSSTLMSMGMMMLPPTTISAPFKILLFVMADGWNLIIGNLVATFK